MPCHLCLFRTTTVRERGPGNVEKSIRASLCLHVRDAQKTVQPAETYPPASPIHDERKTFRMPHAVNGSPFWAAHGQSACTFLRRAEVGPSEGSGFRGVSFHFIVQSREAVDEVMGNAVAAGARRREGSSRRPVGILRVLKLPGRLSLEGRVRFIN